MKQTRSPSSALLPFFGEGTPTKIDYKKIKSWYPYSSLSSGAPRRNTFPHDIPGPSTFWEDHFGGVSKSLVTCFGASQEERQGALVRGGGVSIDS